MGEERISFCFLLFAFLIKEWRVNEIEREKEKGGLFGLGILWIIKIIHPKGISVSLFFFFVFCFRLRERAGRGKERGKAKREKKERWGKERKRKKERERKREERREERIVF